MLFLENAANGDIFWVDLDATGKATKYKILTSAEIYQAEKTYNIDLNLNGGIGGDAVLFTTGKVNTYLSGDGKYLIGKDSKNLVEISVGGKPLTNALLPENWEVGEATEATNGFKIFLTDAQNAVYSADLNSKGEYIGGKFLSVQELEDVELADSLDLNNDSNSPAPQGWEHNLNNDYLKNSLHTSVSAKSILAKTTDAIAPLDYSGVVALLKTIIDKHADNSPLTESELSDLRAIASRGKAAFVAKSIDGADADYLAYVFDKLVNESAANSFWTGGEATPVALGNLSTSTSIDNFKKLIDKWIFGKDLPSTKTGGDSANPAAIGAEPKYTKVSGATIVDGINQADVAQGSLGDCYLVASVLGAADANPARIKAMIVENPTVDGNRTWGVRFFDDNAKPHWVTVNDMFPYSGDDTAKLAYGGDQEKSTAGEMWWPIIEKAYVQANMLKIISTTGTRSGVNSFWAIEGGGHNPLAYISGVSADNILWTPGYGIDVTQPTDLKKAILDALAAKQPVWIGSKSEAKDAAGKSLFIADHAFMILNSASNPNEIIIRNPWSLSKPDDNYIAQFKMSIDELANISDRMLVVGRGY